MYKTSGSTYLNRFVIGKGTHGALLTVGEVNMVHQDGPFETNMEGQSSLTLSSPDGELFQCNLKRGEEGPVGSVEWDEGRTKVTGEKMFTRDYGVVRSNMYEKHPVKIYFKIEEEIGYRRSVGKVVVWEKPLEILMGVKARMDAGGRMMYGAIGRSQVDIYYL
jgi:hypothetical protein